VSEFEAMSEVLDRSSRELADQFWGQAKVIQIYKGEILTKDGQILFQSPSNYPKEITKYYLGEKAGVHYFAVNREFTGTPMTLRQLAPEANELFIAIAMQAQALINWHETHTNCARCGAPTKVVSHGWIRECEVDGAQHFPRTDPAVIVLVKDRSNRLLLGRQTVWAEGKFSNFAGFVEPGENLEGAIRREIKEETGLEVTEVKYLASQPWPFPASIMLAFSAITDTPELAKADGIEIAELKWFSKKELLESEIILPDKLSVSRKMITYWLENE
jgi:NAD+ diphosphatase